MQESIFQKEEKILKKINYSKECRSSLWKNENNDECYISLLDINKELDKWGQLGKFTNKNIICPCDWDITNDNNHLYYCKLYFIDLSKDNDNKIFDSYKCIDMIKIKIFNQNNIVDNKIINNDNEIKFFLKNIKCNFLNYFYQKAKKWKIKSLTVSGYNPANNLGIKWQDIDYSKYDLVVTCPPFAAFSSKKNTDHITFIDKMINECINFIVVSPTLGRNFTKISLFLFKRKIYLGFGRSLAIKFKQLTDNNYVIKTACCDWITTFDDAQKEINKQRLHTNISFDKYKDDFKLYLPKITMKDGTHPIKLNTSKSLPDDYYGWFFVSSIILNNISYDEFEWYPSSLIKYWSQHPDQCPTKHKFNVYDLKDNNNKQLFSGLFIRRKKYKKHKSLTSFIRKILKF